MSTNPTNAIPAQKPPNNSSSNTSNVSGESKVVVGAAAAHTSLDVSGTAATPKMQPGAPANVQGWTDELDSPLWLSSLHSVIFIITCALAVFILFRNVLTWCC